MSDPLERRASSLDRLSSETWDLLVVGGGIVGVAAALDAVRRGARVALVERDDLAVGTSSRSSKLIHGGLRYLEHLQFGLVFQALRERAVLLRQASHLVRLEQFLVPVYGQPLKVPYYGAGMVLYGALGAARDGGFPRFYTPGRARRLAPALRATGLRGAFLYADAVDDDARLNIAVARTAARAGAEIVTRADAVDFDVAHDGSIEVRDRLAGETMRVRVNRVIDATGASRPDDSVMPSRGTHIVVRRDRIPSSHGMTLRVPGRVVFLVPWNRHWIIGTTDVPHDGPTNRPGATVDEVDYLIDHTNAALDVGLDTRDVVATFAGIRPLAAPGRRASARSTVAASREHHVSARGRVVSVRGGKYTTFRVIARDAVDAALGPLRGKRAAAAAPLIGALPRDAYAATTETLQRRHALGLEAAGWLVDRHGAEAPAVAELAAEQELLGRLLPDAGYLEGEVAWAAEEEWALSVDDALSRRMRLSIEARDHGASVAEQAAEILSRSLHWGADRRAAEARRFILDAPREYGVPGVTRAAATEPTPAPVGVPA